MVYEKFGINREELKRRLQQVAAKDPHLVVWFASRCAFRAFPLLVVKGEFKFWNDRKDWRPRAKRISHLMTIWRALLISLCSAEIKIESARIELVASAISIGNASSRSDSVQAILSALACAVYPDRFVAEFASLDAELTAADIDAAIANNAVAAAYASVDAINNSSDYDFVKIELQRRSALQYKNDLEDIEGASSVDEVKLKPIWIVDSDNVIVRREVLDMYTRINSATDALIVGGDVSIADDVVRYIKNIYPSFRAACSGGFHAWRLVDVFRLNDDYFYERVSEFAVVQHKGEEAEVPDISNFELKKTGNFGSPSVKVSCTPNARYKPTEKVTRDDIEAEDALDRKKLAEVLGRLLCANENSGHFTVGLLGEWGSGKSFLLKLIQESVSDENEGVRYLIGNFNAWAYEQSDNIQAGITHEAVTALSHGFWSGPWLALRFSLQQNRLRLLSLILALELIVVAIYMLSGSSSTGLSPNNILFSMLGVTSLAGAFSLLKGLFLLPMAKEFHTYLRLPSYSKHLGQVPIMRKHLKELCRLKLGSSWETQGELKKWFCQLIPYKGKEKITRMVFFVDDLDRCGPEGILKTLEAIRLMMDIPQVTVIIAVDHRIALAALAHHYKELASYQPDRPARAIARDYLGKIIQLPITLTQPDHETVDSFITKQLLTQGQSKIKLSEILAAVEDENYDWELLSDDALSVPLPPSPSEGSHEQTKQSGNDDNLGTPEITKGTKTDPSADMPKIPEIQEDADKPEEQFALPPQLSAAFRYWTNQFHLHNPRQIKRLYNSYNLIWHYYGETEQRSTQHVYSYSRLLGLILLDYLNTLPSEKRKAVSRFLEQKGVQASSLNGLEPAHWEHVREILSAYPRWRQEVEPFVLPALDAVEPQDSTSEST